MRYKIKNPEIEAFHFGVHALPEWFLKCIDCDWATVVTCGAVLRTTYNTVEFALEGDWIARGYNGIPYRIAADEFERLYEPCE